MKQVNASGLNYANESVGNAIVVAVEKDKFFIETETKLDPVVLKEELLKDLEHQKSFLNSVLNKLNNKRFVENAKPEVVALERKKMEDAEARIIIIQERLVSL